MSNSKIKTLVIAALALLNAFFLVFIVWGKIDTAAVRNQALEDITQVLSLNGIAFRPEAIKNDLALSEYAAARDMAQEAEIVAAVLGTTALRDEGGGIFRYEGENGVAVFRRTGDFTIDFYKPEWLFTGGPEEVSRAVLDQMKVTYADMRAAAHGASEVITITCTYASARIFDCQIELSFEQGKLVQARGRCPSIAAYTPSGNRQPPLATAMMALVSKTAAGDFVCTEIQSVEGGYHMRFGSFDGTMLPVWRIVTDGEVFEYVAENEI